MVHILDKFYWYGICCSPVLNFQMFSGRNCHFRLLLGTLDMLQFFEILRNCRNWAKKLIWLLILRVFLFIPLYTLWDTPQELANWKTLLRCICGKFHQYSICGCEIKNFQNFFVLIQHQWNGPYLEFFGPLLPQIVFDLVKTLTRGSLQ